MREVTGRRTSVKVRTIGGVAEPSPGFEALVGESPAMRAVVERLRRIASRDANLLLQGASGTGKELAAQAVHAASARCQGPFVVVDCRVSPRSLVEGKLFESADGGTLFLDEIGELDPALQARLLRLFDRRRPPAGVGGRRPEDVRIIAATALDLCQEAARGRFRTDLYYRLAVNCIRMPSLSERLEDIPLLWRHLCKQLAAQTGIEDDLDEAALRSLAQRPWPGNVRELRNTVERVITFGIEALDTPAPSVVLAPAAAPAAESFHAAKATIVATFEREFLTQVLARHDGNITAAATTAGVDRVHFLRLLDRYGLRRARRG